MSKSKRPATPVKEIEVPEVVLDPVETKIAPKVKQPIKIEPTYDSKMLPAKVKSLLNDKNLDIDAKVEKLISYAPGDIKMLAAVLKDYKTTMTKDVIDGELARAKSMSLYNIICQVLKDTDVANRKLKLDVIHKVFLANNGRGEPFEPVMMTRYPETWNSVDRENYYIMCLVINTLGNIVTRKAESKKVNMESALVITSSFREEMKRAFIKYYDM